VTIESVPYAVLMEANSVLVESYPVPGKLKTEIGSELANRFEWRYYLRGQSGGKLKPGEGNNTICIRINNIVIEIKMLIITFNLQLNLLHKWVKNYELTVKISYLLSLTEIVGPWQHLLTNTLN